MKIRCGTIGAVFSLTIFFLVLVAGAGAVELKGKQNPAQPGKGATDVLSATGPDFTVHYVKKGAVRVQTKFMDEFAKSPATKFVDDGLKKGLSIEEIVLKGRDAGFNPCDLLKAFMIKDMPLQELFKVYLEKNYLGACELAKCALTAARGMRIVEVDAGQYAIIFADLCPIVGTVTPDDWNKLQNLMDQGLISPKELPHYPPNKEQLNAAQCCESLELAQVLLAAGADIEDLRACFNTMGCGGLGYTPAPPPAPAPVPTLGPVSPSS
jgi:hypothetical protein